MLSTIILAVLIYVAVGFNIGRLYARTKYPDYKYKDLNCIAKDNILFVVYFWWLYLVILILGYLCEFIANIHNRLL